MRADQHRDRPGHPDGRHGRSDAHGGRRWCAASATAATCSAWAARRTRERQAPADRVRSRRRRTGHRRRQRAQGPRGDALRAAAFAGKLAAAQQAGGIEVTADSETTAGKTGFARACRRHRRPGEGGRRTPTSSWSRRRRCTTTCSPTPSPRTSATARSCCTTPGTGPRCGRRCGSATPSRTSPSRSPTSCRTSASRAATPSTSAVQAALLRRCVPRRQEGARRLRRRQPHLQPVRPRGERPRHQHRRGGQSADPRDAHDPDRRLLLRPLHGRQVLPGRDAAGGEARRRLRRREGAARGAPRLGPLRDGVRLRQALLPVRRRRHRRGAALVAARRLVRHGRLSGAGLQRGHHLLRSCRWCGSAKRWA